VPGANGADGTDGVSDGDTPDAQGGVPGAPDPVGDARRGPARGDAARDAARGDAALSGAGLGEAGPSDAALGEAGPGDAALSDAAWAEAAWAEAWTEAAMNDAAWPDLPAGDGPLADGPTGDVPLADGAAGDAGRADAAVGDAVRPEGPAPDDARSGERVHALVGQGRFAEAHAVVSDAFVERNGSAGYLLRAWVLAQEQRPAEAREAVDWALALAGPDETADVFVLAGVVLLALDEAHAALTVALRAQGADPDGWEPSVLLSDVYRRLGRVADAAAAARRAVALAPHEAEAQVALARSLSAGRGLFGRMPRRQRGEYTYAVERALTLGAEPGQLVAPRAGVVVGGVGLALFWGVQLYRLESGGRWQLLAAGAVLAATLVLVAFLVVSGTRRSGVGARTRLRAIRATTRTEMVGDDWLWRIAAVQVAAALPAPVLVTAGLAADRGRRGEPWPLWAVAPVTAVGLAGVAAVLAGTRWWYGAGFARRIVRYRGLVRLQAGVGVAFLGATLALAVRGGTSARAWGDLALGDLAWTVAGCAVALPYAAHLHTTRRLDAGR
jgi:tetratricopeptide (TPR) repeat protein